MNLLKKLIIAANSSQQHSSTRNSAFRTIYASFVLSSSHFLEGCSTSDGQDRIVDRKAKEKIEGKWTDRDEGLCRRPLTMECHHLWPDRNEPFDTFLGGNMNECYGWVLKPYILDSNPILLSAVVQNINSLIIKEEIYLIIFT